MQRALFDHMQTLSLSFFDRQPLGRLMSRITNDEVLLSEFITDGAGGWLIRDVSIALDGSG